MRTKAEAAARLRELLAVIDSALIECRQIAGEQPDGHRKDWDWARRADDHLFGYSNPTMIRTIERLEDEAVDEEWEVMEIA